MRRIRALSLMDPEEVTNLAKKEPRSELLNLKVQKRDAGELLRPWSSIKRASPAPLTDEQYDAFLRGDPIPNPSESKTLNDLPDPTRQLAYYARGALLATGATAVLAVIFLLIDLVMIVHVARSLTLSGPLPVAHFASAFGWVTLALTVCLVALQVIVALVQVKYTRGLKRGVERLSERRHSGENPSHQAT
jgi:hypothetical protein